MERHALLLIAAAIFLPTNGPAQAPQPPATPEPACWLQPGAEWRYQVEDFNTSKPGEATTTALTVTAESTATLSDGRTLHQLRVQRGERGAVTFEVWSIDDGVVAQHPTLAADRRGTWSPDAAAMQLSRPRSDGRQASWSWRGPLLTAEGNAAPTAGTWHHAATSRGEESVTVPAGEYTAEHVRIRSTLAGQPTHQRDLWLHPSAGVVRDERRLGTRVSARSLTQFLPGGRGVARLLKHVDEQVALDRVGAFNNTPYVSWLEAGPEALAIAGRIATVHTDAWKGNYLVCRDRCVAFDLRRGLAPAAYAAFDSETAVPSEGTDLQALALLLARSEAALHQFGKVHQVPVTLAPREELAPASRIAAVQVAGGALDGSRRNVAVWLSFDKRWRHLSADDMPR